MYAVLFDLDTNCLKDSYENAYTRCYKMVKDFMCDNGFEWKQRSVYFGDADMDAVKCVLTVRKLARTHTWFSACVRDIRMLRIEEDNDLSPAVNIPIEGGD